MPAGTEAEAPPPAPAEQLRPDDEPATPPAKPAAPARLEPAAQGPYLVQVGSFGDTENAQKEADRRFKTYQDLAAGHAPAAPKES